MSGRVSTDSGLSGVETLGEILGAIGQQAEQLDSHARQRAAVLAFGRRAWAQPPLQVLFSDAANLVAATLDADFTGLGQVAADGSSITLRIAPVDRHADAAEAVTHKVSLGAGNSAAGFALDTAEPVATANLAEEKRFTDTLLRKLGAVGALTVPLHLNRKPYGSLGVYHKQQRDYTNDDVRFAETIGQMLVASIARVKAEEELQHAQTMLSTVLGVVDSLVLQLDMDGRLSSINRACQQVTGFSLKEIRGKPFCSVFVVPEEADLFQGIFRATASSRSARTFQSSLLTKDGSRRHISWSLKVVACEQDTSDSILLSGADLTERIEAERKLQEAKTVAEEATKSLKQLRREIAEQDPTSQRRGPSGDRSDQGQPAEAEREKGESSPPENTAGKRAADLRTSQRREYHYKQWIAPIYGGVIPVQEKFFQVTCENISAGGVAFYLENTPEFEYLVVGLGQVPDLTLFKARVVRVMEKEFEGRQLYLVGCRFTGRVDP